MTARMDWLRKAILPAAVFLVAWAWFAGGGRWSLALHPDESKVSGWTRQAYENGYVTARVYPGGWFQIARARAGLERALVRAGVKWDSWRAQDGAVVATDAISFSPPVVVASNNAMTVPFNVQSGRNLNAFLAAVAALAVFLASRALGAGAIASVLAAAVLGLQPVFVEHVHYCETDVALVAFFAVASWLFCRFLARPRVASALVALFAAGFAISCKYTLAPLIAWIPVGAAVLATGSGRRATSAAVESRLRRMTIFLAIFAALLAVFVAGFLLGTPALVFAPAWFRESAADVSARTYSETLGILGPFAGTRWGGAALRAGSFVRNGAALGLGFWIIGALGAVAWTVRCPRRQALGLPLFLATFLLWSAFGLPWFRAQEFLPVSVVFSIFASQAFDFAFRAKSKFEE